MLHVEKDRPHDLLDHFFPLKSDCRFRKDLIVRKQKDFLRAQEAKEEL